MTSHIQIMRAAFDAFARGDLAAVLGIFDPNIEWREADHFVYADGNPYRGPEAVRDGVFARIATEWDGYQVRVDEMHDAGDTVVATGRYQGTYKATGRKVDAQFAYILKFRNGRLVFFQQYTDTAQFRDVTFGAPPATLPGS